VLQPVRAILGRFPIESRFGHVMMGFYTEAILIAIQTYGIGWQPFTGVRASRQARARGQTTFAAFAGNPGLPARTGTRGLSPFSRGHS
jgi:hypothetical protein